MRYCFLLIVLFSLLSCTVEKDRMLAAYQPMFDAYCSGNFRVVYESLDSESQTLITRLVNNESTDSLIQIGTEYGIPNLAVVKHVYFPSVKDDPEGIYDFTPFLGYLGVSFFNTVEVYQLYPKKSRVGDENFVTLEKRVSGGYRMVEWLKYTMEDQEYKLNLTYILQLNEPLFRDIVYNSINRIDVDKDFEYKNLFTNYPNYRDINYAKRLVIENCEKNYLQ